ncbi:MAG: ROK family protein [Verrucomicrobia bacterium]|nr:ROK family protein [Verrucomicrobiota bacterium]
MKANNGLVLVEPGIVPPLDADFRPAVLANRRFRESLGPEPVPVHLALERGDGSVSRYDTVVAAPGVAGAAGNFCYLERLVKFLLWSRGGYRIHVGGPAELGRRLEAHYRESATGRFDASLIGQRVYEKALEVVVTSPERVPAERERTAALGRHWDGCRIGFDLGASDRKVAAVRDGEVVFSEETPWDPRSFTDPRQHFEGIMESLRRAAAHLPRVDAIGGSSAGVYVGNRVQVASLFRGIPEPLFNERIKPLFLEIKRVWNNIPFEVVNDGEVTALAGAMALKDNAVLGVAMGSSEAAGYVTPEGNITAWLNELAFAPVDYNPEAPVDEWSGDRGCGAQYFSQQCVGRLVPVSGLPLDPGLPLPEKLVGVQQAMARGDERAARIYETIGVYLGYAVAHYAEFYDLKHVLVLGRVTSGPGGQGILDHARRVLRGEFPDVADRLALHMPDEKEKRHGQAMAAASLPALAATV